jgi:hypothetical protein
MNASDAHITRHHNGPASVAGSDYEASYDGVVEDRFTTMPNIELCHLIKRTSSGLNASTEVAMTMAGTRGMIEEAMAIASVKMNRRKTRRPSSL